MTQYHIQIIRSHRKTLAIQITQDLQLLVRAPSRLPKREILRFVEEKSGWVEKHMQAMREAAKQKACQAPAEKLSEKEVKELMAQAGEAIPGRVSYYADRMQVSYGRVTVRCQKTRWGSCSQKGNLNFNCLLLLAPPRVLDYVVVHELCHRKEMNHSVRFWAEVERVMPDYQEQQGWLREHGQELMGRIW